MDINAAIKTYSHAGGNRLDRLTAACPNKATAASLAADISALQRVIVDQVWARAGEVGLSADEIEQLARIHVSAVRPDIDEDGLRGLLGYIVWVAWHDGYLLRE